MPTFRFNDAESTGVIHWDEDGVQIDLLIRTPHPQPPIEEPPPEEWPVPNCLLKTRAADSINERVAPSTKAALSPFGSIPPGSVVKVTEFTIAEGYTWAKTANGWFAVRQGQTWWVTALTPDSLGGEMPPPYQGGCHPGVWVGTGANRDELLRFATLVKPAQPAATVFAEPQAAQLLLSKGWFVMTRPSTVGDCPDTELEPGVSAQRFVQRAMENIQMPWPQVIVLANECIWPSPEYLAAWVSAAAVHCAQRGVRAIVPIVWNPGAPELEWVPVLRNAYRSAPIACLWGVNVYPVRHNTGLAVRDDFTEYTTWRHERYDPGVPIIVTEYARSDGSEAPDFNDIAGWWGTARKQFHAATAWYDAGPGGLGHWLAANLSGKLDKLAAALK